MAKQMRWESRQAAPAGMGEESPLKTQRKVAGMNKNGWNNKV